MNVVRTISGVSRSSRVLTPSPIRIFLPSSRDWLPRWHSEMTQPSRKDDGFAMAHLWPLDGLPSSHVEVTINFYLRAGPPLYDCMKYSQIPVLERCYEAYNDYKLFLRQRSITRSRFPAYWAIVQLSVRLISVALAIATLVVAIYASVRYEYGLPMIGAFIAVHVNRAKSHSKASKH